MGWVYSRSCVCACGGAGQWLRCVVNDIGGRAGAFECATLYRGVHRDDDHEAWRALGAAEACACMCVHFGADASELQLTKEKPSVHSDDVKSVAFSPDGSRIVSGSYDNSIKLWGGRPTFACVLRVHRGRV
eukprot:7387425-Prymnesium_polylepis.4